MQMRAGVSIWDKLARVVVFLLFIAGLLGVAVWYLPLIGKNQNFRREIYNLDKEIQAQEETGRRLKNTIDALRRDPKAVERLARETLGYAKPGETVIRFEPARTNSFSSGL